MEHIEDIKVKTIPCYELTPEVEKFQEIAFDLCRLYSEKNKMYGNAFGDTIEKAGIGYAVGTLLVKANRFATIQQLPSSEHRFESAEDTLMDIANYAIMTLVELRSRHGVATSLQGGSDA